MDTPGLVSNTPSMVYCRKYETTVPSLKAVRVLDVIGVPSSGHKIAWSFKHGGIWYDSCVSCNQDLELARQGAYAMYHQEQQ